MKIAQQAACVLEPEDDVDLVGATASSPYGGRSLSQDARPE
jgi:hypothetical protein